MVVFGVNILANITLMGKMPRKYKSYKLTKFSLNWYWMRFEFPHDRATREYQYPSNFHVTPTWRKLDVYFSEFGNKSCWKVGVFNRSCFCSVRHKRYHNFLHCDLDFLIVAITYKQIQRIIVPRSATNLTLK